MIGSAGGIASEPNAGLAVTVAGCGGALDCGGALECDGELGRGELEPGVVGPADGPATVVAASADEPIGDGCALAAAAPAELGAAMGVTGASAGEAAVTVVRTVTAAADSAEPPAVHAAVATLKPTANAVSRPVRLALFRIRATISMSISVSVLSVAILLESESPNRPIPTIRRAAAASPLVGQHRHHPGLAVINVVAVSQPLARIVGDQIQGHGGAGEHDDGVLTGPDRGAVANLEGVCPWMCMG